MKKNYTILLFLLAGILTQSTVNAQCVTTTNLGSATNMVTLIRNSNSAIAASKTLNTVAFIHRNDVNVFGGNSGQLRYDISTNGGANWSLNLGTMNPVNTNPARYPNIAIYNPSANTNTTNAWLSYIAPVLDPGATTWSTSATGVCQFNATGATETYGQNGIGTAQQPNSLVTGSTGVVWAVDATAITGMNFKIYKGVWNNSNDMVWNVNYTTAFTSVSIPVITEIDFNIAFDPTGSIGWLCFPAHLSPAKPSMGWYPVFYKTTDGGATWTGPIEVDLRNFSCLTSNVASGMNVSINPGNDLVVDVNGNPHMITTAGSSNGYAFNYGVWHHMYDITMKDGLWVAFDLGNVNGSPYGFGNSTTVAQQWQAPQASRSEDGTKIFFTWTDNSSYSLGTPNSLPDLYGKAYNVTNDTWTQTKNFTSCNVNVAGKMMFPHIAPEVLEPAANTYLIPTVYGDPSIAGNLDVAANFVYLNNVAFSISEFSVSVPAASITIQPAEPIVICPNSNVTLNIQGGAGQALWSTSATGTNISVAGGGTISTYSVVAQAGCNTGTASVNVYNMNVNVSASNPSICAGSNATSTLYAAGNAISYTWTAGTLIDDSTTVVSPTVNTTYVLNAGGTGCTYSTTINVGIFPSASLSIAGGSSVCLGSAISLTASGATYYNWGTLYGDVVSLSPANTSSYTLIGTDVNNCVTTKDFVITVVPLPTVSISATKPGAICRGTSNTLFGNGASTYTWSTGSASAIAVVTPTVVGNVIYTVTGRSNNTGCVNTATFSQVVLACTGVEELSAESLKLSVFPNPTNGEVMIEINDVNETMSLILFNSTGQLISQQKLNDMHLKLDLSNQPAGIYFINISQNGKKLSTSKILKE